jgi:hypothetical protein
MNATRGFNRLFVVLSVLWALYCLIIYPLQTRKNSVRQGRVRNINDVADDLLRGARPVPDDSLYGTSGDKEAVLLKHNGAPSWTIRIQLECESDVHSRRLPK